ncbi:MAG: cell division protein SepF, partial [Promethearchaeota archaeon]
ARISGNGNKFLKSDINYVKMIEFSSFDDVDTIKNDLENGNIMILNAQKLLKCKTTSVLELKRTIDALKGHCGRLGGSIARLGDNMLILTPNAYIRINRLNN